MLMIIMKSAILVNVGKVSVNMQRFVMQRQYTECYCVRHSVIILSVVAPKNHVLLWLLEGIYFQFTTQRNPVL